MSYTVLAIVGVGVALALDVAVLRTCLVRRRAFWTAYAIVLFFQLITNGWLTGRDIVVYTADDIVGPRFAYAPVEDLLFGFSMVLQTQAWWVWWGRRLMPAGVSPGESHGGLDAP
jgi:lycopene cyclase domain-containing protein